MFDGISTDIKQEITDNALQAASIRGYCDETKKILSDLGFPTESSKKTHKIVVEIEYTLKPGHVFVPSNLQYNDNNTKSGRPVINIVSAMATETN